MFRKLLYVAALASAAFAQGITIAHPAAGTKLTAGSALVIQLERTASGSALQEVAIAIGGSPCFGPCSNNELGAILYTGSFNPQSTNSAGKAYQNITVTVPNFFDGTMQLSVARFYLHGIVNTVGLELTNTTVTVTGAVG